MADYYLKTDDTSGEKVTTSNLYAGNTFTDVIDANTGTIDQLEGTDLDYDNAVIDTANVTRSTITTLHSTTGTITNIDGTTADYTQGKFGSLDVTGIADINTIQATDGTITTVNGKAK